MATRKDIDYLGRQTRQAEKLQNEFDNVVAMMRDSNIKGSLVIKGTNLYYRYTQPNGKQKFVSPPGMDYSIAGMGKAREFVVGIDSAIRAGIYSDDWLLDRYYPNKRSPEIDLVTVEIVLKSFSKKWLESRKGDTESTDRQKNITLKGYLSRLKTLIKDSGISKGVLDSKLIMQFLNTYPEGSDKKFRTREVLSVVCNLYGISYDFSKQGKRPKPKARTIPSDKDIISLLNTARNYRCSERQTQASINSYYWMIGILATYGLRPQELFAIDLEKSFKPETSYWIKLDETLTEGLKTGDRWIPPLPIDWVAEHDLATPKPLESLVPLGSERGSSTVRRFLGKLSPIKLYDLRHAYAIRCRVAGIDLLDASEALGHDPRTHSKHYQRHISLEDRISSFSNAIDRGR
jgi:integrase